MPDKKCAKCGGISSNFWKSKRSKDGLQTYCNLCAKKARNRSNKFLTQMSPAKYLLRNARQRSILKGIEFNLKEDDIVVPTHCPVFGEPLKFDKKSRDLSPSLDRLDNSKGYIPGNVIVVSWRANRLKSDATPLELKLLAKFYTGTIDA